MQNVKIIVQLLENLLLSSRVNDYIGNVRKKETLFLEGAIKRSTLIMKLEMH